MQVVSLYHIQKIGFVGNTRRNSLLHLLIVTLSLLITVTPKSAHAGPELMCIVVPSSCLPPAEQPVCPNNSPAFVPNNWHITSNDANAQCIDEASVSPGKRVPNAASVLAVCSFWAVAILQSIENSTHSYRGLTNRQQVVWNDEESVPAEATSQLLAASGTLLNYINNQAADTLVAQLEGLFYGMIESVAQLEMWEASQPDTDLCVDNGMLQNSNARVVVEYLRDSLEQLRDIVEAAYPDPNDEI